MLHLTVICSVSPTAYHMRYHDTLFELILPVFLKNALSLTSYVGATHACPFNETD